MKFNTIFNTLLLAFLGTSMSIYAMEESVRITSNDGQEFVLEVNIAMLSGTIVDIVEDAGLDAQIPLSEFSGATVSKVVELMTDLEPLIRANAAVEDADKVYIPRAYQQTVNDNVKALTNEQLGDLTRAADHLDLPYVLNALASVVADRSTKKIDVKEKLAMLGAKFQRQIGAPRALKKPKVDEEEALKEKLKEKLKKLDFGTFSPGSLSFIEKHLTFRDHEITEEYSVADLLKEGKKPKKVVIATLSGGRGLDEAQRHVDKVVEPSLALENEKLTSIFGIDRLQNKETTTYLSLNGNCFYRFDRDAQIVKYPFESFVSLTDLDLPDTCLVSFDPSIVVVLENLKDLELSQNKLSEGVRSKITKVLPQVNVRFDEQMEQLYFDLKGYMTPAKRINDLRT